MSQDQFPRESFDDLWEANSEYQKTFKYSELTGSAAKGLAIVTCMDSRINPLSVVGMRSGDVKILRNAGARVTEDVLRTLVLATYLLNVNRILVMPHTDCAMARGDEAAIHKLIDDLATMGRHTNTTMLCLSHYLTNYKKTRLLLNEATHIVVYPMATSFHALSYLLKTHIGMSKDDVRDLKKMGRWVCVFKHYPQWLVSPQHARVLIS
jgi:carbonic anhydrase